MGIFKQAILISERVSATIFHLPCIYSVHKEADGRLCYLLYDWDSNGQYVELRPGQWLCETYDGKWCVLTDKEYKKVIGDS